MLHKWIWISSVTSSQLNAYYSSKPSTKHNIQDVDMRVRNKSKMTLFLCEFCCVQSQQFISQQPARKLFVWTVLFCSASIENGCHAPKGLEMDWLFYSYVLEILKGNLHGRRIAATRRQIPGSYLGFYSNIKNMGQFTMFTDLKHGWNIIS